MQAEHGRIKAIPHNSSAALAMPFLPSASCRNLDLPPVNLRFLQSHLTKNAFAIAPTHLCGIALIPVELERFMEGRIGTMQKSRVWQARQPVEAALLGLP